jgi:para-nitrobenzyl esterase
VLAGLALAPAMVRAAPAAVEAFYGIRYGAAQRFRAPVAAPLSRGAGSFGPSSPQRGDRYRPTSEDCLYLNVWTPEARARARRPVMVYIHGGAYSSGSAADPLLDGGRLAARGDVVVVTVGHRLNLFGYLSLARLDPRFADSGNAGQLDLILALRWVRDNIAAFGGDPEQVTLFGQSGGGAKIATLMGMPAARGLFHRAATMSGQQVTVSGPLHAEERARAYMAALGAMSVDQLLALPVEQLVEGLDAIDPILGGAVYFGPVLDMKWLHRHPFWPDANPQSTAIPMMLGNTHDETRGFFGPDHPTLRGLSWDNLATRMAPELRVDADPDWVVGEYRRLFPGHTPEQIFFAATTASRSWRAQVVEAEARAAAGAPAFVYQLDHPSPAPHGADIPLVFSGEGPVAEAFLRFARTGDPGWAAYTLPERRTMVFGREPQAVNDPRGAERALFARIPYIQPGT